MKIDFRIRHGQPNFIGFQYIGTPEIQVQASSYSTISGAQYYSPRLIKSTDKRFPISYRTSDGRTYFQRHGTSYRADKIAA